MFTLTDNFAPQVAQQLATPKINVQRPVRRIPTAATRIVALLLVSIACTPSASAYYTSDDGDTIIVMGATQAEYLNTYSNLTPQYRVKSINVQAGLYSAIFEPNSGNLIVAHQIDFTASQMQSALIALHDHDTEMMQVEVYSIGGEDRYAYIAYHRPGPEWTVFVDVPREWIDLYEDSLSSDMNVVDRRFADGYPGNMTALYKADSTDTIDLGMSMTKEEFIGARWFLAPLGYRVTSMEVEQQFWGSYPTPYYRPIFKRDGNLTFTTEAFALTVHENVAIAHEFDVAHMTPMWVAMADQYLTDSNGDFIYDDNGTNVRTYFVGFHGTPVVNPALKPSLENGFFDPDFAAAPEPHVESSKSTAKSLQGK